MPEHNKDSVYWYPGIPTPVNYRPSYWCENTDPEIAKQEWLRKSGHYVKEITDERTTPL